MFYAETQKPVKHEQTLTVILTQRKDIRDKESTSDCFKRLVKAFLSKHGDLKNAVSRFEPDNKKELRMAAKYGSQEWYDIYKEKINSSPGYAEAGKTWEGDFYFITAKGGPVK
ncbi:MAG: hypothetical protein ABIK68_01970, partial [bacterium]